MVLHPPSPLATATLDILTWPSKELTFLHDVGYALVGFELADGQVANAYRACLLRFKPLSRHTEAITTITLMHDGWQWHSLG